MAQEEIGKMAHRRCKWHRLVGKLEEMCYITIITTSAKVVIIAFVGDVLTLSDLTCARASGQMWWLAWPHGRWSVVAQEASGCRRCEWAWEV